MGSEFDEEFESDLHFHGFQEFMMVSVYVYFPRDLWLMARPAAAQDLVRPRKAS